MNNFVEDFEQVRNVENDNDREAFLLILGHRRLQEDGGYTSNYDDLHGAGELVDAAVAVLLNDDESWPFDREQFQQLADKHWNYDDAEEQIELLQNDLRRTAVAGALVVAEMGRLLRAINDEYENMNAAEICGENDDSGDLADTSELANQVADLKHQIEELERKLTK